MYNAKRQKISFLKRFYLLGFFVLFVILAVLISGIYSKKSRIEQELRSQNEVAINLIDHYNDDLLSELETIKDGILLTRKPFETINLKMDRNSKFNAIFYIKDDKVLASDYNKIAIPQEFSLSKFKKELNKNGFYISDFHNYAGVYRYFLIKEINKIEYLLAYVDTKTLGESFKFPNSDINIVNSNGKFITGNVEDIFDIYGSSFKFSDEDKLLLLKDRFNELNLVYFKNIPKTQNFAVAKKAFMSEINGEVLVFLAVLALLFILFLLIFSSIYFLNSKVIAPINEVKKIIMSSNRSTEISSKIIQKGIFKDFSEDIFKFNEKINSRDQREDGLDKNFYDIFKKTSLCVLVVDSSNGMIVDSSDAAKQIYGEDVCERSIFEISNVGLFERSIEELKAGFANENYIVTRQNTLNGQKSMHIQRSYINSGGNTFITYISFDVSKYRNFYEHTNRQFELIQTSPQVMLVYDFKNSKVVNITSNVKNLWGFDQNKFLNGELDFFSLVHLKDVLRVRNEIKNNIALFERTKTENFEQTYRIKHFDNEYYKYSVFAKIIITKGEKLVAFYFQNIDSMTKSEEQFKTDFEFYKNIIDTRLFVTWDLDLKSDKIEFNGNFLKILNYEDKYRQYSISLDDFQNMIFENDRQEFRLLLNDYINGRADKFDTECRINGKDNTIVWIAMQGRITERKDGVVSKISGIFENITERKEAELQLKLNASVFSNSHEGIMLCDKNGLVMRTNNAFTTITGYQSQEVLMSYPSFLFAGDSTENLNSIKKAFEEGDFYRGEIYGRGKDGGTIPVILTINAIKSDKGETTNYMVMFMEIYGIKEKEAQLEQIAHYDVLTKLPNRIYFMQTAPEFMQKAKDSGKFMAVLFIDYDGFKAINDTYGHDVGDIYLREISAVMKKALRENDFLARLGGDEFCAIIPNIEDKKMLTPILNRLLKASKTKFDVGGDKIGASASIGVAFYNGSEELEFKDLLSRADKAMYNAKTLHKGEFSIYEDMSANSQVERLISSIKNNEFFMLYQPMIDAKNNEIFGYELLLRWHHPNMGVLLPGDFLLDLKEADLERVLSVFSLNELAKFQSEFDSVCSINISSNQLCNDEFYEAFAKIIAENPNINPSKFIFEITDFDETSVENFQNCFEKYTEFGVKFAINNANSTNLSFAKNLPFYMVKANREICLNVGKSYDNIKMLKAILLYANNMGFKVGAQGIEDNFSLRLLKNLDFDYLQGNLISKALQKDEISKFISKFKTSNEIKPISKSELSDFLILLEYKKTATEFIDLTKDKKLTEQNFIDLKAKFSEILDKAQNAGSDNFNANIEIYKQILDILTLDYENLQRFLGEFEPKFRVFIKNTEDLW